MTTKAQHATPGTIGEGKRIATIFTVAYSCRLSFLLINTRKESTYISVSILHILTNISSESRPQCYGKVAPSSDVPPDCLFFEPGRRVGLPAPSGKSCTLTTCDGDSFRKAHLLLLLHIRLTMACRTLSLPINLSSLRVSILNQF